MAPLLRTHGDNAFTADRQRADDAGREQATVDPRTVLYAVQAKMAAGLIEEAKAIVAAYRAEQVQA
jgi:hypothetical protein